jgi:hypothetical protein
MVYQINDLIDRPKTKSKIQRSPLDPGDKDGVVVDAPLLKLPKPWIAGAHHLADRKSPYTASEETTAEATIVTAKTCCTILQIKLTQIRRTPGSGRGEKSTRNPQIPRLRVVAHVTSELHGAPPPKGNHADNKTSTSSTSTSQAPPAGDLPRPTLYARRETGFPYPPSAEAADGEGGTHASPVARCNRWSTLKNRLYLIDNKAQGVNFVVMA